MAAFWRRKAQRLARADGSRKGALDPGAAAVVRLLNGRAPFCTTSSCSGRLVLAQGGGAAGAGGCGIHKQNCTWLMVAHGTCPKEEVMAALEKATGDVVLKFEPFVLHVLCEELRDAQLLVKLRRAAAGPGGFTPPVKHSVAVDSGFRNSGITVGKGGKIMMAVRSTHCLEVPLSHKGKLMVSEEYIEFLIHVANQKMEENIRRIDRFHRSLELALKPAAGASSPPPGQAETHRPVYRRRRKRRAEPERDAHAAPEGPGEEPEPESDTESSLGIFADMTI
ncbi:tRNA wybutosine-synthesizing protein 3 homolog isoform X3 [Athene noctua]|uniref:tRNA wybutosine-synthesizing protein 3 homolog isoform X3 n=1 Tax=Athene noctua TaxID=126797 RepID=UPI003EBFBFAE